MHSEQWLIFVIYPVMVAGIIAIFTAIYKLFTNLIIQLHKLEITTTEHAIRIITLERRKSD